MSRPLLFCPAFKPGTQSDRARPAQTSSRKRKRSISSEREQNSDSTTSQQQSETLGVVKEKETAVGDSVSESESSLLEDDLASLMSPSLSSKRPSHRGKPSTGPPRGDGLRRQHLAAISAVLHKCLLQGDYIRAGRAWALLLRSEVDGLPIDLRRHSRWGIGAEILLQQSLSSPDLLRGLHSSPEEDDDERNNYNAMSRYSGSLQSAQDFYDRLIVQYPYRNASAKAVGPLDFYPVRFGLRIFSVQHDHELRMSFEASRADASTNKSRTESNESSSSPTNSKRTSTSSSEVPPSAAGSAQMAKCVEISLNHAREIANQLDELLFSPPYSEDGRLRELRSMVVLWIDDLRNNSYYKNAQRD